MDSPFLQTGLVFILAAILGVATFLLRQPLILAYILTGIGLGSFNLLKIADTGSLVLLSKFGIAFLLFMVGLELKLADLRQIGKIATFVGFGQMFLTFIFGLALSLLLGFGFIASSYLALALSFSSTIVVVKLLSEKDDLSSLSGRIAIGILLVQDFVAILLLMFLGSWQNQTDPGLTASILILLKGSVLFLVISILTRRVIPSIFSFLAQNQELLFLAAVAWCFLFATVAVFLGFTIEIGAFLAGVSLSSLPYHYQISSRIRPLRDLFLALFFVGLGMQMILPKDAAFIIPVLVLTLFAFIVKPLAVMVLMGLNGFRKRTSFMVASSLGQISEFSLILIALGQGFGHLDAGSVSVVTGVAILSITLSSLLTLRNQSAFQKLSPLLAVFEKAVPQEKRQTFEKVPENHVILVGCNRTGTDILEFLRKTESPFLVVDFDPEIYRWLESQNVPCLFGDITDEEILKQLNLPKAKVIISTVPNLDDNLVLVNEIKARESKAISLLTAAYPEEESQLYKAGADYVILPQFLGGKHVAHLLSEHLDNLEEYLYNRRQKEA